MDTLDRERATRKAGFDSFQAAGFFRFHSRNSGHRQPPWELEQAGFWSPVHRPRPELHTLPPWGRSPLGGQSPAGNFSSSGSCLALGLRGGLPHAPSPSQGSAQASWAQLFLGSPCCLTQPSLRPDACPDAVVFTTCLHLVSASCVRVCVSHAHAQCTVKPRRYDGKPRLGKATPCPRVPGSRRAPHAHAHSQR